MTAEDTVTMPCQGCDGTGETYADRFAGRQSTCRECSGEGWIHIPADEFVSGGAA